jgi:hypothetical protein
MDLSLLGLEQIPQISVSEIVWHSPQKVVFVLKSNNAALRSSVCRAGLRNKCKARRNAVFLPIPGSLAISSTANSILRLEKFIASQM